MLSSLGGGATLVWLMSGWLGRVWAARMLEGFKSQHSQELEALKQKYSRELEMLRTSNEQISRSVQAELDKNVYVTKAHFDVELAALKLVWQTVNSLRLALNSLGPMRSLMPAEETSEEKSKRLNQELLKNMEICSHAFNAALSAVEDQQPFYPRAINDCANSALQIAQSELEKIRINTQRFAVSWYVEGNKSASAYGAEMGKLESSIRNHMEKLSIRQ